MRRAKAAAAYRRAKLQAFELLHHGFHLGGDHSRNRDSLHERER